MIENGAMLERKAGLRPIITWLLSVTVTLQLFALALPEFLAVGLHEESKESEWTHPLWVITESLKSLSIGFAESLSCWLVARLLHSAGLCF